MEEYLCVRHVSPGQMSMKQETLMKKRKTFIVGILFIIFVILVGIWIFKKSQTSVNKDEEGEKNMPEYVSITMEEAKKVFETQGDYIILDVRREDEFAEGHIPGAINVPNEDIQDIEPSELPDKNQTIYVYCRSGNRSKQAASKLVAMGYNNIIEFGGIMDWTGNIE